MDKPRVLVLGGCGFIGRNLVSFLASNDLASAIRVVDKVPPQVAWLNEQCQKYFQNPIVEFKSANLINPESCKNAFACSEASWDYVINCAGETKLGQTDPVYEEGILKLSLNCAKEAVSHRAKHYIELSSGKMNSEKVPLKEDGPVEPWSFIGKWKYQVEEKISDIPDLKYTILRLASVYGQGDRMGLTPRIIVASIYKHLGETMKLLWNADLKINTVHVTDVCRAIWFACNRDDTIGQQLRKLHAVCRRNMRWYALWWFAAIATVVMLEAKAAPSPPRSDEMLKELLNLDRMYSAIARPSVRSGPTQPDSMGPKVQRAINMLRLQHLDQLYADRARPRFGKRVETNSNFAPIEYEGQYQSEDVGDWLPLRR